MFTNSGKLYRTIALFCLLLLSCGGFSSEWSDPQALNADATGDSDDDLYPRIKNIDDDTWAVAWFRGGSPNGTYKTITSTSNGSSWGSVASLANTQWTQQDTVRPAITTDRNGNWFTLYATLEENAIWGNTTNLGIDDNYLDFHPSGAGNENGYWLRAWQNTDDLHDYIYVNRSTIATSPGGSVFQTSFNGRPDIECGSPGSGPGYGTWCITWMSFGSTGTISCARSTNDGATWNSSVTLDSSLTYIGSNARPSIASDRDQTWIVVWTNTNGSDEDIFFSRSTDNGASWSAKATLNSNADVDSQRDHEPAIATDGLGKWICVWASYDSLHLTKGSDSDILYSQSLDNGATWSDPQVISPLMKFDGATDEDPDIDCSSSTWVAVWKSAGTNLCSGSLGSDSDILYSRMLSASPYTVKAIDSDYMDTQDSSRWNQDYTIGTPTLSYNSAYGAYLAQASLGSVQIGGWRQPTNSAACLPYSAIGTGNYVRAKFFMYASDTCPDFRLRMSNRFAVANYLELIHNGNTFASELKPSTDPTRPSIYRLDYDPVDIPFIQTSTVPEAVALGFECFNIDGAQSGYIAMTESSIGVYPISTLDPATTPVKVYQPSGFDAGDLKIFNTSTDYITQNAQLAISPYQEGTSGITLDSASYTPNSSLIWLERQFYPGSTLADRIRIEENKLYKIRWHVVSSSSTSYNPYLALKVRSLGYLYNTRCEFSGALHSGLANSQTFSRQVLPGVGCANPDKSGSENGGWYTMFFSSPMSWEIRPESGYCADLSSRMPLITSQPGPGETNSSQRDLRLGIELKDSISGSTSETGNYTVDRIEVFAYNQFAD